MFSFVYTRHISLERKAASWEELCDLWVMADKYQVVHEHTHGYSFIAMLMV